MENNDELLARIRRSQQSTQSQESIEEYEKQATNDNTAVQDGNEEANVGFFKKYSFPLPAFLVLIFSIITPFLIFGVTTNVLDMEFNFFELKEYIVVAILIGVLVYYKACLNKWIEKNGVTVFSRIVRILCTLQIWIYSGLMILDAYKWYKLG